MESVKKRPRGRPPYDDLLTRTEWRIVHAVQHGMTTREIADRRGVSRDAVKYHIANAMAKLGIQSRKALREWFRAPKDSALHEQERTMTSSMKLGPIGQISRTVHDIRQAESWYKDVLGLQHLFTSGTLAFFDCGGVRLFLSQAQGEPAAESILYLKVDDIQKAHHELKARGVEFINPPHLVHRHADGMEEWMAIFKDPEGRPLAIMEQARR